MCHKLYVSVYTVYAVYTLTCIHVSVFSTTNTLSSEEGVVSRVGYVLTTPGVVETSLANKAKRSVI